MGEEVATPEKPNERKRPREGGTRMGEGQGCQGRVGRAGPDRAGSGCVTLLVLLLLKLEHNIISISISYV
jgi:hypothetical protein